MKHSYLLISVILAILSNTALAQTGATNASTGTILNDYDNLNGIATKGLTGTPDCTKNKFCVWNGWSSTSAWGGHCPEFQTESDCLAYSKTEVRPAADKQGSAVAGSGIIQARDASGKLVWHTDVYKPCTWKGPKTPPPVTDTPTPTPAEPVNAVAVDWGNCTSPKQAIVYDSNMLFACTYRCNGRRPEGGGGISGSSNDTQGQADFPTQLVVGGDIHRKGVNKDCLDIEEVNCTPVCGREARAKKAMDDAIAKANAHMQSQPAK